MAKETEKPQGEEGAPKKGNKLKLIILALLALILLGGGGFAYWFIAIHGKAQNGKPAVEAEPEVPPMYTALDAFTVNLKDPGVALQTEISLKVHDEKVDAAIKQRMPEIRARILLLLSSQQSSDLMTVAGKEKLGSQILVEVNKILAAKTPKEGVSQVLFTSFIIQ